MPIRTQLLKKWVGPDPEKHIGSTPLLGPGSVLLRRREKRLKHSNRVTINDSFR